MDLNRIPPVLLQTFLTVAEAGQISEAARRLHLSQPAVTGHIRRLEASLETTLFIRSANGVSLTERGAHLRERVQDVELGGLPGEFYQFANSIRSELSAVSVHPSKEAV